jgi:hypothetical protein
VAPAPLSVTANNATKILAAANPTFSATYSGFVNGDTAASLSGTLTCTSTATATSPGGSYPITCSGLSSTNYSISYVAGTLKILYAPAGGTCLNDLSHTILQPIVYTITLNDGTAIQFQFGLKLHSSRFENVKASELIGGLLHFGL